MDLSLDFIFNSLIYISVIYVKECSMFSSKSFIVPGLTFRSLIYFEFIFVYDVRGVLISFFYV